MPLPPLPYPQTSRLPLCERNVNVVGERNATEPKEEPIEKQSKNSLPLLRHIMLTIEEIKKMEPDTGGHAPTLKACVLEVSNIEEGSAKAKPKFYAVLADATGSISATIYDHNQYSKFIKGFGVVLVNVLLKQSYVAVTSRTEVAICQGFEIPSEVKDNAPALPGHQAKTLEDALQSPVKSIVNVKGRIVKLSPATTKTVNDKDVPFQELVLKDKSTKLTLAVWEEMVDSFEVGQKAKFSKCRVRLFNEEKKLSTTTSSASEVYTEEDDLDEVSSEDETMSDSPGSTQLPTGTLIAVFEVDPYLACPKVSCNNTKLETLKEPDIELYFMFCKRCNIRYKTNAANIYMRATMLLKTTNEEKKITVFSPQIKKLLESRGLDSAIHFDRKEMLTKLLQIIPIDIHYTLVNNTVRNLTCKRIQDV
ncbi:hypothetical protein KUTeg_021794 [Tegillarca granosa]|uniref:Uncharacterized protein n=1 Tax=Tegillarca granosa TaxID=220873 RepID=A0ABQ9E580_TEGGR|nr:hypothetical protein KUTeg_021794 [Tegillarca granosa]